MVSVLVKYVKSDICRPLPGEITYDSKLFLYIPPLASLHQGPLSPPEGLEGQKNLTDAAHACLFTLYFQKSLLTCFDSHKKHHTIIPPLPMFALHNAVRQVPFSWHPPNPPLSDCQIHHSREHVSTDLGSSGSMLYTTASDALHCTW